jgi:hypothetical protein
MKGIVQSDVSSRYRTYDSPPAGFDPGTAPQEVLRRYGLPRRPDPEKEPKLAALWKEVFDRPTTYITAQLELEPVSSGPRPAAPGAPIAGSWGGAQVPARSPSTDPMNMVFAQWVVPTVSPLNQTGEGLYIVFWVGLFGGDNLMQAGVRAKVPSGYSDTVEWDAWTEWYSMKYQDAPKPVTNLPIAPGDTVCFLVCAPQPNVGYVSISNLSQGFHTSVTVVPSHADLVLTSPTAVWAVETTGNELPFYYSVEFNNCVCSSQQELYELTPSGVLQNVTSIQAGHPYDYPITHAYIDSPTRLVVPWLAFA